jgi:propane 2-monooxygenase small subunit
LFLMLAQDQQHGETNRRLFLSWAQEHGKLAMDAANLLQPIWSQPRVKVAQFSDALEQAKNRSRAIAAEIGFDIRTVIGA